MNTSIKKLMAVIEKEVTSWEGVTSGIHSMGGKEFLFNKKEIGHIHDWNGDLDILFGKQLTEELLKHNMVQQHKHVPAAAITWPVRSEQDIPFAISLLRLSYLKHLKRASADNSQIINDFEMELKNIMQSKRGKPVGLT